MIYHLKKRLKKLEQQRHEIESIYISSDYDAETDTFTFLGSESGEFSTFSRKQLFVFIEYIRDSGERSNFLLEYLRSDMPFWIEIKDGEVFFDTEPIENIEF